MISKVAILLAVVAWASAQYGHHHEEKHHVDYYAPPHYNFHYEVHDEHTGDIKSHKEERKDDHTQGEYSLVEPDGSKRTVQYSVEGKHGGFNAVVHRQQTKHVYHPQPKHHQEYHHQSLYHQQPAHEASSFATYSRHEAPSKHY